MSLRIASAPAKTITAFEAAALVQSGFWLDYGGTLSQPDVFARIRVTPGTTAAELLAVLGNR